MNNFVRAFVVALALTGAVATTSANTSSQSTKPVVTRTSAYPIPSCPPAIPAAADGATTATKVASHSN